MNSGKKSVFLTLILFIVFFVTLSGPSMCEAGKNPEGTKQAVEEIRIALHESQQDRSGTALVSALRYWSNPDYTRVAVILDSDAVYEYHHLKEDPATGLPPRLYLDIKGARVAQGVRDIPIGDGLLRMARIGQYRKDVVRVVLDIDTIKDFKVFPLSDPYRIIVDVKGERKTEISRLDESIRTLPLPKRDEKSPGKADEIVKREPVFVPGKIRRLVIDPGHGGHDPGAVGADGTKEKDVVLDMSLKLADKLRRELGLDVVMTRSTDVFIPLEERTAIANKVNADLFVSIHANASLNRAAAGIETYYLNLAKTEKAKHVAARENNTSLEKVGLLQGILFDLMANYKLNDSARLADDIQKSLYGRIEKDFGGTRNLGVKQGPFYVLVGATMPSVLVEVAFISNEMEAERLKNPEYQNSAVSGIVDGIREYIAQLR